MVREPRTNSDTQRIGNATWEFRNTMIAAQIGVGPKVFDAWCVRHATSEQKSGLHIVCEYFPNDLHDLLVYNSSVIYSHFDLLRTQTLSHLQTMANNCLFCYDLKPSNIVLCQSPFQLRFIDFGRDFTEWRVYSEACEFVERAPISSFIQRLADALADERMTGRDLYPKLLYYVMVSLLSSNISFTIQQSSHAVRYSFAEKQTLNFLAECVRNERRQINPKYIPLIKEILRHRDLRDTIRHYMGRRNCGTKRTFHYACFVYDEL